MDCVGISNRCSRNSICGKPNLVPLSLNPSAGGLLGGTEYEGYGAGRCNCIFEKFYPWMIQPRLGVNYQLDAKDRDPCGGWILLRPAALHE